MNITMKYTEKDFFGETVYRECVKQMANRDDVMKCFRMLKKSMEYAVELNGIIYTWDLYSEYNSQLVTKITYDGNLRTDEKMSFADARKEAIEMVKFTL